MEKIDKLKLAVKYLRYQNEEFMEHIISLNKDLGNGTIDGIEEFDVEGSQGMERFARLMDEQVYPHSGDCTNQPWTCMRCLYDRLEEESLEEVDTLITYLAKRRF